MIEFVISLIEDDCEYASLHEFTQVVGDASFGFMEGKFVFVFELVDEVFDCFLPVAEFPEICSQRVQGNFPLRFVWYEPADWWDEIGGSDIFDNDLDVAVFLDDFCGGIVVRDCREHPFPIFRLLRCFFAHRVISSWWQQLRDTGCGFVPSL